MEWNITAALAVLETGGLGNRPKSFRNWPLIYTLFAADSDDLEGLDGSRIEMNSAHKYPIDDGGGPFSLATGSKVIIDADVQSEGAPGTMLPKIDGMLSPE